jgi:hopanoid biosynthesis associated protein HpnK
MARTLIVTADDFGLDRAVNEAVESTHVEGILTCASLMVAAPAAADAVARAKRLPRLGVGLHVTLVDGTPALPPEAVSALVDADGRFPADPYRQGVRLYCSPRARAQALAEMRAQFERFAATGLPLDHVNAHHHFHLHPVLQRALVRLAGEFGVKAVRVPFEPGAAAGPALERATVAWQAWRLRRRLGRHGIAANDRLLGLAHSGHMTRDRVRAAIAALRDGVSELYFHPVARAWQAGDPWPADYDGVGECHALLDPAVRDAVRSAGARLATFAEAWSP